MGVVVVVVGSRRLVLGAATATAGVATEGAAPARAPHGGGMAAYIGLAGGGQARPPSASIRLVITLPCWSQYKANLAPQWGILNAHA